MEKLILIGAGGFGREVAGTVTHANRIEPRWEILGFLDDDPRLEGRRFGDFPVLGSPEAAAGFPDASFVCCILDMLPRMRIVQRLEPFGVHWGTLVHPSATILGNARVGEGGVISPFCGISGSATLGRHVYLNYYAYTGPGSVLGDHAVLSPHAVVAGQSTIGEGAFLGCGACVLPGIDVGAHAIIGAAAVVDEPIPPDTVAVGVPARVIKSRELDLAWLGSSPPRAAAPEAERGEERPARRVSKPRREAA